ncbi:MAG: T9SS type A sorting domain-containing protein [Syntrophothermus sp.]
MKLYSYLALLITLFSAFSGFSSAQYSIRFNYFSDESIVSYWYSAELVRVPLGMTMSFPQEDIGKRNYVTLKVWDKDDRLVGDFTSEKTYVVNNVDFESMYIGPGRYHLLLQLNVEQGGPTNVYEVKASQDIHINVKYVLYASCNIAGGTNYLEGIPNAGFASCLKDINEGVTVSVDNQKIGSENYAWNESGVNRSTWKKKLDNSIRLYSIPDGGSRTCTYYVQSGDNRANIISDLRLICNLCVQNNIHGNNNLGLVCINDVQQNSPYVFTAVDGDQVKLTAVGEYIENSMRYIFDHWENSSVSAERYIEPKSHGTYTAFYKGIPVYTAASRNMNVTNYYHASPVLTWAEHPNSLVNKYRIFRKVTKGKNLDPGSMIAEVPRGTLTYTDYEYFNNGSQYQDMIFYTVDAYCATYNTSSEQSWMGMYFGIPAKRADTSDISKNSVLKDPLNSLTSYPNPFNPTAQINYSIREGGLVTLRVYDIIGNMIAELVNEYKPAGSYMVGFDGSNKPSGCYICTIKAGNYSASKKLLLVK